MVTPEGGPSHERARRRALGAYYTPEDLARELVEWALCGEPGPVLDPSFGGCSFLTASLAALRELSVSRPGRLVHGVDIDPEAAKYATLLTDRPVPRANLQLADFLSLRPGKDLPTFRAVVGNPPYIRHHSYRGAHRATAQSAMRAADIHLPVTASSWAHFVVHGSRFLKHGGRLAYLLPNSALHADYAKYVYEFLEGAFQKVRLLKLNDRVFPDADSGTVVLLAEGFDGGPGTIYFEEVDSREKLEPYLRGTLRRKINGVGRNGDINLLSLPSKARDALEECLQHKRVKLLGDTATIRIGVVTGANSFFVRRPSELKGLRAEGVSFRSVIARGAWLTGPTWTRADCARLERADLPCKLMIVRPGAQRTSRLTALIRQAREAEIHLRTQCLRRAPWFYVRDYKVPNAFIRYMGSQAPSIVENESGSTCCNSVHRLFWNKNAPTVESAALGSWTSLFRLGAEVYGRAYGGGVLKLEPSGAQRLPVPCVPPDDAVRAEVFRLVRQGDLRTARAMADDYVLNKRLGLSDTLVNRLRTAADRLEQQRNSSA